VVAQVRGRSLLSDDHFSVDGAMIAARASMKSIHLKDQGNGGTGSGQSSDGAGAFSVTC